MNKQKFLNTYVNNVTMDETLNEIENMILNNKKCPVCKQFVITLSL